jgi:UDP-glucuronate 4-epimerase
MSVLVTGAAGFIGFHLALKLLENGEQVIGLDGMTDYYDVMLKERRLAILSERPGFTFKRMMLEDDADVVGLFRDHRPRMVFHLAAQAGVRYSIEQPRSYIGSNVVGTFNILEACRRYPVEHLMLASTSSAYGANVKYPFEETDSAIHPITLYAATKASTELMAHCYAHLFEIPVTAFRFFTVYGPWGRPDMAYFKFAKNILDGKPIDVYNHGDCWRDFTFVDDLIASIRLLSKLPPPLPGQREGARGLPGDTLSPVAPYRLVNIGGGRPVRLTEFIDEIEKALGVPAIRLLKPLPPGDVVKTFASADLLEALTGQKPSTPLSTGIPRFVSWYRTNQN